MQIAPSQWSHAMPRRFRSVQLRSVSHRRSSVVDRTVLARLLKPLTRLAAPIDPQIGRTRRIEPSPTPPRRSSGPNEAHSAVDPPTWRPALRGPPCRGQRASPNRGRGIRSAARGQRRFRSRGCRQRPLPAAANLRPLGPERRPAAVCDCCATTTGSPMTRVCDAWRACPPWPTVKASPACAALPVSTARRSSRGWPRWR